jgi:hypothetical protein
VTLRADGTGVEDYGSGTTYKADNKGVDVLLLITGTVTFDYRTNNGTVSFSNVKANGTLTLKTTGLTTSAPLTGDDSPAKYTCSDNKLTEQTELATIELSRS